MTAAGGISALAERVREAGTQEELDRAGEEFLAHEVADFAEYVPFLSDPSSEVRYYAMCPFFGKREPTLRHAEALLPLLADADTEVRRRSLDVFRRAGRDALPVLRDARRRSNRWRTPVLELLIDLAGFDGLDPADRAAVSRLIDIKGLAEQPEQMHLCGSWLALPTSDRGAVLEALELSDPMPVTMALGERAWNFDKHDWEPMPHRECRRMYVAPVFDGWTLVFGDLPEARHRAQGPDDGPDSYIVAVQSSCARLSERFGEAHWYGMSCGDSWTSWCIARGGEVRRYFDAFEDDDAIGEPLPEEGEYPDASQLARAISVDPGGLGAGTVVEGRGLLALTCCGREHGMPPGLFEDF